jgi:hypothetical protein
MRLLNLTIEEIEEVVTELDADSKAIKKELYKMCWFMRGGLSFEEAYQLDRQDREVIAEIIESNLETTKETRMPFF